MLKLLMMLGPILISASDVIKNSKPFLTLASNTPPWLSKRWKAALLIAICLPAGFLTGWSMKSPETVTVTEVDVVPKYYPEPVWLLPPQCVPPTPADPADIQTADRLIAYLLIEYRDKYVACLAASPSDTGRPASPPP